MQKYVKKVEKVKISSFSKLYVILNILIPSKRFHYLIHKPKRRHLITIVSCTNRLESNSLLVAKHYEKILESLTKEKVHFLDLAKIDLMEYSNLLYAEEDVSASLSKIQQHMMIPSSKFVFIVPEYNGGMPGILKLFIDAMSVKDCDATFLMKKACLTGVSSGRAGNLRGMDHLTGILNYLQVVVFPNRLPISNVGSILNKDGIIQNVETQSAIQKQMDEFLRF